MSKLTKRVLSLLLAMTMVVSGLPVNVLAAETEATDIVAEEVVTQSEEEVSLEESVVDSMEKTLFQQIQEQIDAILVKYLGTSTKSQEELEDVVINMPWDTMETAFAEINVLEESAKGLTEEEVMSLGDNAETLGNFQSMLKATMTPSTFASKTVTVLDGQVSVTDSSGTGGVSNGVVTITVRGGFLSGATNNITIYNETDSKAVLVFDYAATNANSFTLSPASGTHTATLEPNGSVALSLGASAFYSTATLTLSNFSLTPVADKSNIAFNYDNALGSVSVGGTAVSSGDIQEVTAEGADLVATPNSGATFLGWVDTADRKLLSTAVSYTLEPIGDMTVEAVFVNNSSAPHFRVNKDYLFDNLNDAINCAQGVTNKIVILANDGILPAGEYTIPAGVTLLIPFDDADTLYTTSPAAVNTYVTPKDYRTLTMANGAELTINGVMSLSAKHFAANGGKRGSGSPTGDCSFVKMEENSAITINNGGALYAYGYITGSGNVTAKNGAVVYENFQIEDFRGGTQTTDMKNGVFPLSQYYVQNIEVPLTIEAGAQEYSYTSIYMSSMTLGSSVAFISNTNAMFNLTSGYVTKHYDGTKDRLVVEAVGNMSISPITMKLGTGLLAQSINSKNYELPINSNITVQINSGNVTISQDMALLPGAEIIIKEGAICTLGSNNNVYVYDADQWGNFCGSINKTFLPVQYAPSRTYNRTAADLVDATIQVEGTMDASAGYIYTTEGGANIYSAESGMAIIKPGTQTVTYQLVQNTGYTNIPITSAKLKNTDGTYVDTTKVGVKGTYNFADGVWNKTCEHSYAEKITTAAGCETGGLKTLTCSCGDSYTEVIPAIGHREVIDKAVAATCTETGLTEGKHCSVCNKVLVAQEEVPVTGHTEVVDKAVAPTCTETGLIEGKHCSVCNEVLVAQEEVAATGHTPGEDATCTTAQTCSTCGEELVAASGHDMIHDEAVAATCTEDGYSAGSHCSRCDHVEGRGVIPATGHTEVIDEAVAATCTETGLTEGKHCFVCNEVLVAQEGVEATGHTEAVDEAVAPTCTETGLTEGKHCSTCDVELVAQEVVDASGHDMTESATCTEPIKCQREGCTYTEGEALGHTEVIDEEIPALCEDTGLTEGEHCSVCQMTLVQQVIIPALGHDIQQHEAKKPTYSNVGWETYENCSRCAYTTYVEIPALEEPIIKDYDIFMENLALLEEMAYAYTLEAPGKDPAALVIKYIRTGVDRYNSGSWGIMAGYEDADFAKYVAEMEDAYNAAVDESQMIMVSGLKNIEEFEIPNGNIVDFGHMFGTMDITYHNNDSVNHADVAGWAGDIVDLLSISDEYEVTGTLEEMVADISENYLGKSLTGSDGSFNMMDMYGDLDGYYIMQQLYAQEYERGTLSEIIQSYFTEDLNDVDRADYFLRNRLDGVSTRAAVRDAVYNAYTGNKVVSTLEATRDFVSEDLATLRKASCYAFADYICKLAGDYVDVTENPYYTVFSSTSSTLAPGITQEIKMATSADNKQMVYYIATADITRSDVDVYANYNNNDPASGWAMQRVLDQANAAQEKYGNPESEYYIPNYNVIASTNGSGYDMSTGEPSGLLVMNGKEYHSINSSGFFGILDDGTAVIGTTEEYNTIYKARVKEGIAGFGSTLVKDGEVCISRTDNYYSSRASRTAVGITKTGKVVLMVLDGRQEPISCGGSMEEIAQIMLEAGCVHAINLDGGGSTTYVAKQEGTDELAVINNPSDGAARSVSTSLMMVSTAPSSTAFDHAILNTGTDYMTVGTTIQITPTGVSATGNATELPEGTTWAVSDERWATITENGELTALRGGSVDVSLILDEEVIGTKTIHIVTPDKVYFTKTNMDAVYGSTVTLPVKVLYEGKEVAITANDLVFTMSNEAAGTIEGFNFTGNEASELKNVTILATLSSNANVTASLTISLYNQGEATFDFEQATGGDRQLAWDRKVSNSTTDDAITYTAVDVNEDMETSYILAMDMAKIPIPSQLEDLIYMLPGADMENASAWGFLLQLAERVSVLTNVTPVVDFDDNFDVDYSELTIVNEYFELTGTEFDESTNSLSLKLNWRDQTAAIDPETANPICIVSGIKLTPKADADWGIKNSITAVNTGEISYEIYLRANGLYSFAQKTENQETYNLYPFVNPNDESEKGGYFGDVYKTFGDTYTLVNAEKDGWVNEDGGFAYYVDGVKSTGIQQIDGFYYNFGENGINVGQTKYTGLIKQDGGLLYSVLGTLNTGWNYVDGNYYYFDPATYYAKTNGTYLIDNFKYTFDENGVHTKGQLVRVLVDGKLETKYIFAGRYVVGKFSEIEGKTYWFNKKTGYMAKGDQILKTEVGQRGKLYEISKDGVVKGILDYTGSYACADGSVYGVINGTPVTYGIYEFGGNTYFCNHYEGILATGKTYVDTAYATENVVEGWHYFDETGRMYHNEFVEYENSIYYMIYGAPGKTGVFEIDGERYYAIWNGQVQTGKVYITESGSGGLLSKGWYYFDDAGKMYHEEFATVDGKTYYMVDGQPIIETGVIERDGALYCSNKDGSYRTGKIYVTTDSTNGIVSEGWYYTDEFGRFYHKQFVSVDEKLYYMVKGQPQIHTGVSEIEEALYCFEWNGVIRTGKIYITDDSSNNMVNEGWYYTDETGRFYNEEFLTIDGKLYYMVNGQPRTQNGVCEINESLYCFEWNGAIRTGKIYVTASSANDIVAEGWYYTDEAGRFYNEEFLTIDGKLYYMVNGQPRMQNGVCEIDGSLYCFEWNGILRIGKIYITESSANGMLTAGWYYTDETGRFYNEEFFTIDGKLYYMVNGQPRTQNGVCEINGSLYCFEWNGVVRIGKIYVTESSGNGLLSEGWYYTDETGRFYHEEFRTIDEKVYYMVNGQPMPYSGVVEIEGSLYCFEWNGALRIGKIYVTADGGNGLVSEGWCYTDDTGRIYDNEFVEIDGNLYYIQKGAIAKLGVFELENETLYYADKSNGKIARNEKVYVTVHGSNDLIIWGYHTFDETGKMLD